MSVNQDKIVFPDYEMIVENCKKLIVDKFPNYKNSWTIRSYDLGTMKGMTDNKFWNKRLTDEVEEFFRSKTIAEAKKELEDIINICAMIHENLTYTYPARSI